MFDFNIHHLAHNANGLRVYFGSREGKKIENCKRPVFVVVKNGYWQLYKNVLALN